jgi:asparagine synthase (glutamine-hydrolysing)
MRPARLAAPIFGIVRRSPREEHSFTREQLDRWSRLWVADPENSDWWIDTSADIALFRPEVVITDQSGRSAALAVRGLVTKGGRMDPPSGWAELPPAEGTATILYDLLERDIAALRDFRGSFALAFWNGRRRELLLARDHFGQRALFVLTQAEHTAFCSELAPLLRPGCALDPEAALWYLAFGMAPPGRTLARGVERVPAAHAIRWEPGEAPRVDRYWTPLSAAAPRSATADVVDAIRGALDASIVRCVGASSEYGVLLSGGIDSTYLAATVHSLGCRGTALTAAFEPEHGMNETEYAAAVAGWLGFEHHVVPLHAAEALDVLEEVVLTAAEPCSAWASLTHFKLLAKARQADTPDLLSGLGADEIFGGYDHFRGYYARFLRYRSRRTVLNDSNGFEAVLLPDDQSSRRVMFPGVARFFDDGALRRGLCEPYHRWHYASYLQTFYRDCRRIKPDADFMEMMVAHECQHRIPDLLLSNFEPISRRMGVCVAYPFLDPDLLRLVAGLNVESRYRTATGQFSLRLRALHPRFKHAMLQVAQGRVPPAIRDRPRKSLTAPFGAWMFDRSFREAVLRRVEASRFWDAGIVRRECLGDLLRQIVPGPSPAVFQLWALVTLTGWYDRFVADRSR